MELIRHALSCPRRLGDCPVSGCAIVQRILTFASPEFALMREKELSRRRRQSARRYADSESVPEGKRLCVTDGNVFYTDAGVPMRYIPASEQNFTYRKVRYNISPQSGYHSLLSSLSWEHLRKYIEFIRSNDLQAHFGGMLKRLIKSKFNHGMFNVPVHPIRDCVPDYFEKVSCPIDLITIRDRLTQGEYSTLDSLLADIRLAFSNAMSYYPADHHVYQAAVQLERILNEDLEQYVQKYNQMQEKRDAHHCESCEGVTCILCGEKCIHYSGPVVICDGACHERLKRNKPYYIIRGKKGKFCQGCLKDHLQGIPKCDYNELLLTFKNDQTVMESWAQCSRCRRWLHCVCGLVHPRETTSTYVCPLCLLNDPCRVSQPYLGARMIMSCPLSDFLQAVLMQCVDEVNNQQPERYRIMGDDLLELKNSFTIRVVSNVPATLTMKPRLAPLFFDSQSLANPSLTYQSKCIAFFQRRNGIDLLLFMLYVYEFGDHTIAPNRRCVYISYLDSVHFLSPRFLRTPLFHSILNGYLDYAKRCGYARVHVWSCPPMRGDDYIFCHHPVDQRTPNAEHLIKWYKVLFSKSVATEVVTHITCQLDQLLLMNSLLRGTYSLREQRIIRSFHLDSKLESMVSLSYSISSDELNEEDDREDNNNNEDDDDDDEFLLAGRKDEVEEGTGVGNHDGGRDGNGRSREQHNHLLHKSSFSGNPLYHGNQVMSEDERTLFNVIPYFDGDYLLYVGEDLLTRVENETLKARSSRSPITHPPIGTKSKAENHLFYLKSAIHHLPSPFLRKYAESMLENPSRFMVVYLRDHCCRCGCVIEGLAKRCDTCKHGGIPFVLCTQCYPIVRHDHPLTDLQYPLLQPVAMPDPTISHIFTDRRWDFLRLCQDNFLQFDTLRQSILSSSVVIEMFLHHVEDPFLSLCDGCECILDDHYYECKECDYRVCKKCFERDGGLHTYLHNEANTNQSNRR